MLERTTEDRLSHIALQPAETRDQVASPVARVGQYFEAVGRFAAFHSSTLIDAFSGSPVKALGQTRARSAQSSTDIRSRFFSMMAALSLVPRNTSRSAALLVSTTFHDILNAVKDFFYRIWSSFVRGMTGVFRAVIDLVATTIKWVIIITIGSILGILFVRFVLVPGTKVAYKSLRAYFHGLEERRFEQRRERETLLRDQHAAEERAQRRREAEMRRAEMRRKEALRQAEIRKKEEARLEAVQRQARERQQRRLSALQKWQGWEDRVRKADRGSRGSSLASHPFIFCDECYIKPKIPNAPTACQCDFRELIGDVLDSEEQRGGNTRRMADWLHPDRFGLDSESTRTTAQRLFTLIRPYLEDRSAA